MRSDLYNQSELLLLFQRVSDVYEYIKHNPGAHLRKISKKLIMAMGDVQYKLNLLEKAGSVKSRQMGLYKAYYSASILGERNERILAVLQHETQRDILIYLMQNPGASQGEVVRHKGLTAPTINGHISRLIEIGLVLSYKEGKFVKYYIEGDIIKDIVASLKSYHPSVWNTLSNRFAELFLDLTETSRPDLNDDGINF